MKMIEMSVHESNDKADLASESMADRCLYIAMDTTYSVERIAFRYSKDPGTAIMVLGRSGAQSYTPDMFDSNFKLIKAVQSLEVKYT